jgi:hypothetical protein
MGLIRVELMKPSRVPDATSVLESSCRKAHLSLHASRPAAKASQRIAQLCGAIFTYKDCCNIEPAFGMTWSGRYSSVAPWQRQIVTLETAGCEALR